MDERERRAWADSLPRADRLWLAGDVEFFAWYYLGVRLAPHQRGWIEALQTAERHLQLSPRAHGKSTVFSYLLPVYAACHSTLPPGASDAFVPPNCRVLIVAKNQSEADKYGRRVRETLERNELIRRDFGDVQGEGPWTDSLLYCRRVELPGVPPHRDATIECIGRGSGITGSHFDLIILDDPFDYEDVRTPGGRKHVEDYYFNVIEPLAETGTRIFIIGTRKHWDDLYQRLLDHPLWSHRVETAILGWPERWEQRLHVVERQLSDGTVERDVRWEGDWSEWRVLWPERRPPWWVVRRMVQLPPAVFWREYQNDPSLMRGRMFDAAWLVEYDERPPDDELLFVFGVDLAISTAERADWFAVCVAGVDRQQNIWVVHVLRERMDAPSQLRALKMLAARWRPRRILIEANQYQAAAVQFAREAGLPAHGYRTVRDKVTRLQQLIPDLQAGRVRVPRSGGGAVSELVDEYLQFPDGQHDDCLDALYFAWAAANEVAGRRLAVATGTSAARARVSARDEIMERLRESGVLPPAISGWRRRPVEREQAPPGLERTDEERAIEEILRRIERE